tara:strand:+ start:342 stop:518 length:177 start_codon:yes stop_codon:yes gene_type:complete
LDILKPLLPEAQAGLVFLGCHGFNQYYRMSRAEALKYSKGGIRLNAALDFCMYPIKPG